MQAFNVRDTSLALVSLNPFELVHEDAPHLGMEMLHLWYKSYSLHSIGLRKCTIQHGRSDQICSYSETVGPDWSGMRTSISKYVLLEVQTGRSINRVLEGFASCKYVLRGARSCRSDQLRSYGETVGSDWSGGQSDQLHSYTETVGSDWSGRYTE